MTHRWLTWEVSRPLQECFWIDVLCFVLGVAVLSLVLRQGEPWESVSHEDNGRFVITYRDADCVLFPPRVNRSMVVMNSYTQTQVRSTEGLQVNSLFTPVNTTNSAIDIRHHQKIFLHHWTVHLHSTAQLLIPRLSHRMYTHFIFNCSDIIRVQSTKCNEAVRSFPKVKSFRCYMSFFIS